VDEYLLSGKRIYVIGEGRLVNLAAAEGHPASVMDMSFATQALASAWVVAHKGTLTPKVYDISPDIEKRVADLKLASMGVSIDVLTPEQKKYLESWQEGT
jgi:adenosylhomocysteinase